MPSYTRDAVGPSSTAEARIGSADLVHLKGRDQAKVRDLKVPGLDAYRETLLVVARQRGDSTRR